MESKMENQPKRNCPPRVGEWSYYDSRSYKKGYHTWIINIEGRKKICRMSLLCKEPNEQPFISCLGKITAVKYMVKGQIHY